MSVGRADRVLLLAGLSVFVAMIAVTAFLTRNAASEIDAPTTYSAESKGAKAAYLLLKAAGYRTERWEGAPADLQDPETTTLIMADPIGMPKRDDRAAIQSFMARGGRVIATGVSGSLFLSEAAEGGVTSLPMTMSAVAPSPITRAAPTISIAPDARWRPGVFAMPLYGDENGAVVVKLPVGRGEAIWWADATPLTNAGLRNQSDLDFFLACLGPAADRRVLWDEYFHGYRYSLAGSIWHSQVRWLLAQAAVLALAVLVTYSRRSGPIVSPAPVSRLSPLEFVRTLGSLYQRAGATTVAVDIASERFRSWLSRRLGVRDTTSIDHLADAAGRRPGVNATGLAETLRACEAAHGAATLRPNDALALVQSLSRHAAALQVYSQPATGKTST